MHTISMLRRTLGLSSDNQVRNRMERIKDLLAEHIRRGPNNQIFLTDPGLELMKQFQELHDSGLTLREASQVIRATSGIQPDMVRSVSSRSRTNETKADQTTTDLTTTLLDQVAQIRAHLSSLQQQLSAQPSNEALRQDALPWWTYLREDVDAT
jgi:hypothetical protein